MTYRKHLILLLLGRLYDVGISSKLWRLLRMWYTEPKSMVKLNGSLSHQFFTVQRCPARFCFIPYFSFSLWMDPLLQQMESKNLGPSLAGQFMGASAHADDVRTVTHQFSTLFRKAKLALSKLLLTKMVYH